MMQLQLSNELNDILSYAREEAMRLGNYIISTDHLILGMIRHNENITIEALASLGANMAQLKAHLEEAVMAQEPQKAKYLGFFSFLLVFTPLMPITLPLLIVNIVRQSKANKKYKQEHDEWINKKYSVNDAAARRKDELLEQASELVNA